MKLGPGLGSGPGLDPSFHDWDFTQSQQFDPTVKTGLSSGGSKSDTHSGLTSDLLGLVSNLTHVCGTRSAGVRCTVGICCSLRDLFKRGPIMRVKRFQRNGRSKYEIIYSS